MMSINETKDNSRLKQGFKGFVWLAVMFHIFVVLLPGVAAADDALFITAVGGTGNEESYSVVQTSDGGYIVAGHSASYGGTDYDLLLVKFDSSGVVEWTKTVGGTGEDYGYSVIQASDGGYVVAGVTQSYGGSDSDLLLVKFDSSGAEVWTKIVGGTDHDHGSSVIQSSDGGYVVAGDTYSYGSTANDFLLIKFNSSGVVEWTKTVGDTGYDEGCVVIQTSDGGYAMAGHTSSYGGDTDYDLLLVKFNSSGAEEWTKVVGGANHDLCNSLAQTSDGGYVVAGVSESYGGSDSDFLLVKFDSSGAEVWTKTVGNTSTDYGYSVTLTSDGGYVMTGFTQSYGGSDTDLLLVKFNSSGAVEWTKTIGGTSTDVGVCVVQTSDGGYVVTGSSVSYGNIDKDLLLVRVDANGECGECSAVADEDVTEENWDVTEENCIVTEADETVSEENQGVTELSHDPNENVVCYKLIPTLPIYSNFTSSETTNFLEETDLTNVTNLTLATDDGKIQFPTGYGINADTQKYDDHVIIGDCFVSVNTSALDSTFNATAFLTFNNSDGHCGDNIIYETEGFPSSAAEIRKGNKKCILCSNLQKTNNFITRFNVAHFSAYAIGSNTRLDIYDEYEGSYAPASTDITFYANYTNYTSGDHIGGADCIIEFDDNPGTTYTMTDNGANYNYTKPNGFSAEALHTWNVTCSNATGGWNTLNATDDIQVGALAAIPEFSIITLGFGLIAVLGGLLIIRRKV